MDTFCTIISSNYLPFVKVLHSSLQRSNKESHLQVLVIDGNPVPSDYPCRVYSLSNIDKHRLFKEIERKYAHTSSNLFRWALKPLFMSYLLNSGFSKVIFADPDLYFTSDHSFLFEKLDHFNIILTPHWPAIRLPEDEDSLFSVMRGGLYNAGFIAANTKAITGLDWWAEMCHFKMEQQPRLGIHDDQKYLDVFPIYFDAVHILRHKGCNLASWNIKSCKREMVNGRLLINREFEPVFIHFAKDTIINILNRNDVLLKPYLDEYLAKLNENGFDLLKNIDNYKPGQYESPAYQLKHRTRLRTRIKRFFYKLAERL